MKVAATTLRKGRISKLAELCALMAALTGCQRDTHIPAKSPAPVRLAEVTLYASPEGLRYSASIVPFARYGGLCCPRGCSCADSSAGFEESG